ncbi:MAG: hypothetical protein LM601_07195 [Candidatus Verstraetearchaeota archaeon]|nr:hypothetical protein [Candidatus Verstraetearchaeota archaeon]
MGVYLGVPLYDIFNRFKGEAYRLGWRFQEDEWMIEGANELVFYSLRDYSNTVPTYVVEGDLDILLSKMSRAAKGVKVYGVIFLSPSTTGLAEQLIADHSEKVALITLDVENRKGGKLNRTDSRVIHFFIKWLSETYGVKFEDVTWPFERREAIVQPSIKPVVEGADITGEPINFRGMVYAPLNEAGVILLFARVMDDLGIIYESSPPGFPDMVGRRKVGNAWQRVRIEFEYKSSNFKQHGHDPSKCDIIVCWEHDWPECPLEVIELRDIIRKLRPQ